MHADRHRLKGRIKANGRKACDKASEFISLQQIIATSFENEYVGLLRNANLQCLDIMNKRKIEINELKKVACKGKKTRTITVKYETVLAFFKQKESKDLNVFQITFVPVINDLLNHLLTSDFVDKLESDSKEPLKALNTSGGALKLQSFQLKAVSKEYPIQEICSCLVVEGADKRHLSIIRSKLMSFFKHLRAIYPDFCYCAGEKVIVETAELRLLYQLFEAQWNKIEEKGRLNPMERLQKKICKNLYFIGILIENNILEAIDCAERRKREEESECGTRSEHKKIIRGINQQSTVHTFSSLDPSNLSIRLKSQASHEDYPNSLSQYSEKSQKIISRSRFNLWDKAQLKQLRFRLAAGKEEPVQAESSKYQINYLSNEVQNILIEQAFKIEKLFTSPMEKPNHYVMVDYAYSQTLYHPQHYSYYIPSYPYSYAPIPTSNHHPQPWIYPYNYQQPDDVSELSQLKRSLGCLNLVQTRKNDKDRYQ